MPEFDQHIGTEASSEKSFGVVFAAVFILIALYPLLDGGDPHLWAVGIALLFVVAAYLTPSLLAQPNRLWFKLGMALGAVVAPIVMGLVYFTTVVPVGLIMRLMGKDLLQKKMDADAKSYWIERKQPVGTMKNQF